MDDSHGSFDSADAITSAGSRPAGAVGARLIEFGTQLAELLVQLVRVRVRTTQRHDLP